MKAKHIIKMILGGLVAIVVFGLAVMLLWNWLMPSIFGLTAICFWQALGLLVLARLLFGGFGHHHGMMRHGYGMHKGGRAMREKWMKMTPEQRKDYVEKIKKARAAGECFHAHHFGGMPDYMKEETEQPKA